ncbi:thrombospondin type 3 repeat-containing protein [Candidatus Peregrinibacteria bacterium]|nr:thrombospondin type 3 repeat-containing protein [Candidatus Peregrinibacteria bacterium]
MKSTHHHFFSRKFLGIFGSVMLLFAGMQMMFSVSRAEAVQIIPQCNGKDATLYVNAGVIVHPGKPDNGDAYAGTLTGDNSDDVIVGTDGNDVINAGNGKNTVCAQGGNDTITSGQKDDWVDAGDGNDRVDTGNGNNTVNGGDGNDIITAKEHGDSVNGGAGFDFCKVDNGNNDVTGCEADDDKGIIIVKDAQPDDAQDFHFTGELGNFDLDDDADGALLNYKAFSPHSGTLTVQESDIPSGWALDHISCNDPDHGTSQNGNSVDIDLNNNEAIVCTFTNTQVGKLTITKAIGDGANADGKEFKFIGNPDANPNIGEFSLYVDSDPETPYFKMFSSIPVGSYKMKELVPSEWMLSGVSCDGTSKTPDEDSYYTFDVMKGADMNCTFTNKKDTDGDGIPDDEDDTPNGVGDITIQKVTDEETSNIFTFFGGSLDNDTFSLHANGQKVFPDMPAGSYSVQEFDTPRWLLSSVVCNDEQQSPDENNMIIVDLENHEQIVCTFYNKKDTDDDGTPDDEDDTPFGEGNITIVKSATPEDGRNFDFQSDSLASFTLNDDGDGPLVDTKLFSKGVGIHFVTEESLDGWILTDIVCVTDDQSDTTERHIAERYVSIDLDKDENISCTFTNKKDTDNDGVPDIDPAHPELGGDNCPNDKNSGQEDADGDGKGDVCDSTPNGIGKITIQKTVSPNEEGTFGFTADSNTEGNPDLEDFNLVVNANNQYLGEKIFDLAPVGSYTITEAATQGWMLFGISCDGTTQDVGPLTIDLKMDDEITCTFVNKKDTDNDGIPDDVDPTPNGVGTITIQKDITEMTTDQFRFSVVDHDSMPYGDPFTLDVNAGTSEIPEKETLLSVPVGSYTVTESETVGWKIFGVSCDNEQKNLTGNSSFTVDLVANLQDITCIVTNEPIDTDQDEIPDIRDNCPLDPNTNQQNTDANFENGDSLGDACDPDDDGDGIFDLPNGEEQPNPDNCQYVPNQDQTDTDGDGIGDACENDTDGDGILNETDNCPLVANPGQENGYGTSAGDACEDTDVDTILDARDNCPLDPNTNQQNTDANFENGDSLGDACDLDDDGDGFPDVANDQKPADNCQFVPNQDQTDTDGDGAGNACDLTPNGATKITIQKAVSQATTDQFTFSIVHDSVPYVDPFALDVNTDTETIPEVKTFESVPAGSYTITESATQGWTVDHTTCIKNNDAEHPINGTNPMTISLVLEDDITCTFTNAPVVVPPEVGTITIKKELTKGATNSDFKFSGDLGTFSLDLNVNDQANEDQKTFESKAVGSYTVKEENQTPGWKFSNISCIDDHDETPDVVVNNETRSVAMTLSDGHHMTCTFKNEPVEVPPENGPPPGGSPQVPPPSSGGGMVICPIPSLEPVYFDIYPVKGAELKNLSEISYSVTTGSPSTFSISVNGALQNITTTKLPNGGYHISADVSSLALNGNVQIVLTAGGTVLTGSGTSLQTKEICPKDAFYTVLISPTLQEEKNTQPGGEELFNTTEPGRLFSEEELKKTLTRGYAASVILDLLGKSAADVVPKRCYPDVSLNHPFVREICLAKELGLMQGYGNGLFRPDQQMTKAEAIKTIYKAIGRRYSPESPHKCADLVPGAWYILPMRESVKDGVLEVDSDNMCKPGEKITLAIFENMIKVFSQYF